MGRARVAASAGMYSDGDIAAIGALLADRGRCRMLLALNGGLALPASRLAAEAGVSAATASSHLGKLAEAGLLAVEVHGRHRYYRLAGPAVSHLLDALQQTAPARPLVRKRDGAMRALRDARTCYDHLAGSLGVDLLATLLARGYLTGGDGTFVAGRAHQDPRAGYGHDIEYALTATGEAFLAAFGVRVPPRRELVRYCIDWSEQRHHLAGALGRGFLDRLLELGWIRRAATGRAVHITAAGRTGLSDTFGVALDLHAGASL